MIVTVESEINWWRALSQNGFKFKGTFQKRKEFKLPVINIFEKDDIAYKVGNIDHQKEYIFFIELIKMQNNYLYLWQKRVSVLDDLT